MTIDVDDRARPSDRPTVSIVTPCFNQARFIERTLRSVLMQDYPNVEYIVLDGGSKDGSAEIIKSYADRLSFWVSEPDQGQADALSRGFCIATGEIMAWINSDDMLLPGAVQRVVEYFNDHPDINVVNGGTLQIAADDSIFQCKCNYSLGVSASYRRLYFVGQRNLYQQSTFWRREAYTQAGGINPDLHFIMDLDLFARMSKSGKIGRLPHLIAAFRYHDEAKSATIQDVHERELTWFHVHYSSGVTFRLLARIVEYYFFSVVYAEKVMLYIRKPWMTRKALCLLRELNRCSQASPQIA